MRACSADCGRQISTDKLVCYSCWKLIPRSLMARLYAAWNDGDMTDDYDPAVDACLEAIEKKKQGGVR